MHWKVKERKKYHHWKKYQGPEKKIQTAKETLLRSRANKTVLKKEIDPIHDQLKNLEKLEKY